MWSGPLILDHRADCFGALGQTPNKIEHIVVNSILSESMV